MKLRFQVQSHTEQNKRPGQSDCYLVAPFQGGVLTAVMDGVGNSWGDVAAETVRSTFASHHAENPGALRSNPREALNTCMEQSLRAMEGKLGATTCTAVVFQETGGITISHIGDCAVFQLRSGKLKLLTKPDRLSRHVLSRALHGEGEVPWRASTRWHTYRRAAPRPGDVYLIASDGCYEDLPLEHVTNLLGSGASVEALVHASIVFGATDNTTAIVVRVGQEA